MAEQFAFDEVFRQGRTVQRDERPLAPLVGGMDGMGGQLLACAALAVQQHRRRGRRHLRDLLIDKAHGIGIADKTVRAQRRGQSVAQAHVLFDGRNALVHDVLPRSGRMGDHGRDDGQDALVFFQRHGIRKDTVHGKGAQDFVLEFDGHTDEGDGVLLQVTGTGTVQKDGAGRNIGNDHGLAALDDAPRDALTQRIMAPPLLGGIQAVGHLDADLAGMGRHEGDHAPHHVQVLRHQRERRLQAVADVAGMVDDLGKVEQQPQLADRFTYALPMRRQHRRCGGSRPFLIRGGRIRRWRLLVSFHAQGSPFRLPADIPARLQLLEIGHLSFPGIRHRKRHANQDTQGACTPCHGRGHTGAMRERCPYRE